MGYASSLSQGAEKEAEKRTDAGKGGWTPDAAKEGKGCCGNAPLGSRAPDRATLPACCGLAAFMPAAEGASAIRPA